MELELEELEAAATEDEMAAEDDETQAVRSLQRRRRGLGLPSSRASIPPSWNRLYQS
jgi:hypothetical protein